MLEARARERLTSSHRFVEGRPPGTMARCMVAATTSRGADRQGCCPAITECRARHDHAAGAAAPRSPAATGPRPLWKSTVDELTNSTVRELGSRPTAAEAVTRHLDGVVWSRRPGRSRRGEHDLGGTDIPTCRTFSVPVRPGRRAVRPPARRRRARRRSRRSPRASRCSVDHRAQQRPVDLGPRGVTAGVDDAPVRVPPSRPNLPSSKRPPSCASAPMPPVLRCQRAHADSWPSTAPATRVSAT